MTFTLGFIFSVCQSFKNTDFCCLVTGQYQGVKSS